MSRHADLRELDACLLIFRRVTFRDYVFPAFSPASNYFLLSKGKSGCKLMMTSNARLCVAQATDGMNLKGDRRKKKIVG